MAIFAPVWVSSAEHLAEFADIFDHWPRRRRWLGFSAPLRKDFPQVRTFGLLRWMRSPLIFFASGILYLDHSHLQFAAKNPPRRPGLLKWFNLRSDLAFELPVSAITAIARYEQPRAEFTYYKFDWIRVTTGESGLAGTDFLLAVGNYGVTIGKIRHGTADLYETLQVTISAQRSGTGATLK